MEKIKLDIIGLSSSHAQSGSFALVLGESEGGRRLPIIIGMFEAQAIAIEIEKITPNRPMTHDLFKSFAGNFEIDVKEIIISDLKEGVFFAKIVCIDSHGKKVNIDARPSDAIAIGIRFDADIYTNAAVMEEAGIVVTDEFEEELDTMSSADSEPKEEAKGKGIKKHSVEELNRMLDQALAEEDYEKAAQLRDELNRRN
ncbi:bifunctional nuclease family protein [Reichenbachiella carrageenanivorans]|uniref:Bifunctional nuclease family protein n=1 Tax=Reichenbachiella carrageenanivorans TaxID=2979869 RepID=A0ABY6CXU2_9BACT|nr:bifunctional nuclease family protein [Reichenbachiella carrageenanivorans]UXX78184.1 bifunctional nuclease family protein [Reichenbachiella carrageenanivorans]